MPRCCATKADGKACKANARHGSVFCAIHHKKLTAAESDAKAPMSTALPWPTPMSHGSDSVDDDNATDIGIEYSDSDAPATRSQKQKPDVPGLAKREIEVLLEQMQALNVMVTKIAKANGVQVRKPAAPSEKRALVSAKWAFYNQYKNDPAVIADIEPKLQSVGMLLQRTRILDDGSRVIETSVPFHYKKAVTDAQFELLSEEEKEQWKWGISK
jgi:hypothetical protein